MGKKEGKVKHSKMPWTCGPYKRSGQMALFDADGNCIALFYARLQTQHNIILPQQENAELVLKAVAAYKRKR